MDAEELAQTREAQADVINWANAIGASVTVYDADLGKHVKRLERTETVDLAVKRVNKYINEDRTSKQLSVRRQLGEFGLAQQKLLPFIETYIGDPNERGTVHACLRGLLLMTEPPPLRTHPKVLLEVNAHVRLIKKAVLDQQTLPLIMGVIAEPLTAALEPGVQRSEDDTALIEAVLYLLCNLVALDNAAAIGVSGAAATGAPSRGADPAAVGMATLLKAAQSVAAGNRAGLGGGAAGRGSSLPPAKLRAQFVLALSESAALSTALMLCNMLDQTENGPFVVHLLRLFALLLGQDSAETIVRAHRQFEKQRRRQTKKSQNDLDVPGNPGAAGTTTDTFTAAKSVVRAFSGDGHRPDVRGVKVVRSRRSLGLTSQDPLAARRRGETLGLGEGALSLRARRRGRGASRHSRFGGAVRQPSAMPALPLESGQPQPAASPVRAAAAPAGAATASASATPAGHTAGGSDFPDDDEDIDALLREAEEAATGPKPVTLDDGSDSDDDLQITGKPAAAAAASPASAAAAAVPIGGGRLVSATQFASRTRAGGPGGTSVEELLGAGDSSGLKRVKPTRKSRKNAMAAAAVALAQRMQRAQQLAEQADDHVQAARLVIYDIATQLCEGGLAQLLKQVKRQLVRNHLDEEARAAFLRLVQFVLAFRRLQHEDAETEAKQQRHAWEKRQAARKKRRRDDDDDDDVQEVAPEVPALEPGEVASCLDLFTFSHVIKEIDESQTRKNLEQLGNGVAAMRELLMMFTALQRSPAKEARMLGDSLARNVMFERSVLDVVPRLLRQWEPQRFTRQYTVDLFESAHALLKAATRLAEVGRLRSKKKRRKKRKEPADAGAGQGGAAAGDAASGQPTADEEREGEEDAAGAEVDLERFLREFMHNNSVRACMSLLQGYRDNSPRLNHILVSFLTRMCKTAVPGREEEAAGRKQWWRAEQKRLARRHRAAARKRDDDDDDDQEEEEDAGHPEAGSTPLATAFPSTWESMLWHVEVMAVLTAILNDRSITRRNSAGKHVVRSEFVSLEAFARDRLRRFVACARERPVVLVEAVCWRDRSTNMMLAVGYDEVGPRPEEEEAGFGLDAEEEERIRRQEAALAERRRLEQQEDDMDDEIEIAGGGAVSVERAAAGAASPEEVAAEEAGPSATERLEALTARVQEVAGALLGVESDGISDQSPGGSWSPEELDEVEAGVAAAPGGVVGLGIMLDGDDVDTDGLGAGAAQLVRRRSVLARGLVSWLAAVLRSAGASYSRQLEEAQCELDAITMVSGLELDAAAAAQLLPTPAPMPLPQLAPWHQLVVNDPGFQGLLRAVGGREPSAGAGELWWRLTGRADELEAAAEALSEALQQLQPGGESAPDPRQSLSAGQAAVERLESSWNQAAGAGDDDDDGDDEVPGAGGSASPAAGAKRRSPPARPAVEPGSKRHATDPAGDDSSDDEEGDAGNRPVESVLF